MQKKVSTLAGIIIIAVVILILFGGVFAYKYTRIQISSEPFLKFSSYCPPDGSLKVKWNDRLGIISKKWLNNSTMKVSAYYQTSCGGEEFSGNFTTPNDNTIILEISSKEVGPLTNCVCRHSLTYTIYNLIKKDYSLLIVEK